MAATDFIYTGNAARVVFGPHSLDKLESEIERLGAKRALVLCTPQQRPQAQAILDRLGPRGAGIFDQAQMHVPLAVARKARAEATRLDADCALAVGGGSTIGLGKSIALESGLPIVAVPTTYAGSEMTPIYGITADGVKKTGTDLRVLPRTVIYDPQLTLGLPVAMSLTSGINAIAHAAEGMYARDGNPIMSVLAEEGIRALALGLPVIHQKPQDLEARTHALYGAWLCGTVLGHVGMALHHKLCHTLGGSFDLPHAEVHTVVLAHALSYNRGHAPDAMARIARAMGADDAPRAVFELARDHGAPVGLHQIGMKEQDLDKATDIAMATPYWNPRPLERHAIRKLLQRAFEGLAPL
jgi:maleylacetate reductase